MKVFVDTNVLLDVLLNRQVFYDDSVRVWTLAESASIHAVIAAISFNNCYYIVRKSGGRANAEKVLFLLRDSFSPVALTPQIINQAIDADFADFEDAIQYYSALHARAT